GGGRAGGSHRLAERPDRGRQQGDVLDQELAEDADGREPPEFVGPGARGRYQEAEGAQEHPDRQQAADGRHPGEPGAGGDAGPHQVSGRPKNVRQSLAPDRRVRPGEQRTVLDEGADALGLVGGELHPADPQQDQDQAVAEGVAPQRLGPGAEAGQDLIEPEAGGRGRRTGVGRGDRGHDNLLLGVLVAGRGGSPAGFAPSDDAAATALTPALLTFFGALPLTERTNEVWLQSLGELGAADEAAVAELREVLRRGLRRALAGRAAADDGFIEDMTQEGVLKVLGGLTTFRGDSRLTTWAITVAVRVAFTELRRARWKDVSLDRLVEVAPVRLLTAPPAHGSSQDARQVILAEMHRVIDNYLTDRQRRALVAEFRGMPQAEIAAQMGLTRNALYKLTHDARQSLKRGLETAGID